LRKREREREREGARRASKDRSPLSHYNTKGTEGAKNGSLYHFKRGWEI